MSSHTIVIARALVLILLWLFVAGGAQALVTNVTGTVTPATVTFAQTSSVRITWQVLTLGGSTITSPAGTFLGPGVIGKNNKRIVQPLLSAAASTNVITEVLLVPPRVTYTANKNGQMQITYQRQFSNSMVAGVPASVTGTVTLNIGGSAGSGFLNLSRMELRFDTDEIVRVAARDEKLTAVAKINYSGTGLLDAVWEVADPASTPGTPVFFPLRTIRQYLGAGRTAVLQSPPLPTGRPGNHIVRLKIKRPAVGYELPLLQYNVNPAQDTTAYDRLPVIKLHAPGPFAVLHEDTAFRWYEVAGARAYQLEIHTPGNQYNGGIPAETLQSQAGNTAPVAGTPPVTGILIPADRTSARLSGASRKYLDPARSYLWRVLAIGENGLLLGASEMRDIRTR